MCGGDVLTEQRTKNGGQPLCSDRLIAVVHIVPTTQHTTLPPPTPMPMCTPLTRPSDGSNRHRCHCLRQYCPASARPAAVPSPCAAGPAWSACRLPCVGSPRPAASPWPPSCGPPSSASCQPGWPPAGWSATPAPTADQVSPWLWLRQAVAAAAWLWLGGVWVRRQARCCLRHVQRADGRRLGFVPSVWAPSSSSSSSSSVHPSVTHRATHHATLLIASQCSGQPHSAPS